MSLYSEMLKSRGLEPMPPFAVSVQLICVAAALVAIGMSGAWTALWLFPVTMVLASLMEVTKRSYWNGFNPYIKAGAERGDVKRLLFWNVLTAVLDWVFCSATPVVGAFLLEAFTDGKPLASLFKWLYFWWCAAPFVLFPSKKGRLEARLFTMVLHWLPLVPLALSFFLPVDGLVVLLVYAFTGIPVLGFYIYLKLPEWIKDFDRWYGRARSGVVQEAQPAVRWWRPREGVLFEPPLGSQFSQLGAEDLELARKSVTVLRVNWFGFTASLTMLIVGCVLACRASHSLWLLLIPPCALFGSLIGLSVSEIDRKRESGIQNVRASLQLAVYAAAGVLVLWLGGHDLARLIAAGCLIPAAFMFFLGFVVRGSSEGVNDTLDFLAFVAGIAAMIVCRQYLNCVWWESLLPLVLSAGVPAYIRGYWPRKDLPEVPKSEPPLLEQQKKDRRERRRARQLAAFRRSQGR